jgi:L-ascorbate metabolism protein UlaG (beta-lactamase superfamily)
MIKHFGAKASPLDIQSYSKSQHWDGKKFLNLEETKMDMKPKHIPSLMYKQLFQKQGRTPSIDLPIQPFNFDAFMAPSSVAKYIWYGHSVILMRIENKTILIDPMFGSDASPIAPFATKRFSSNTPNLIDELPPIDAVLFSHDHYDHIDYGSLKKLIPKTTHFYTAMGVGRHLKKWGVNPQHITEFDWWETLDISNDIQITFTPTRHFSGRGLSDRAKSLWGGWVFKTTSESIYFSGDGGYGPHFKEVGKRFGPFDIGFVECGQYNELWHQIHMYPEEAVQACIDAQIRKTIPVHWGGFALALHTWKDPIERFVKEAMNQQLKFSTPSIGELFQLDTIQKENEWWHQHE